MNRLKELREERELNQSDIAKKLNISTAAYSYYENEKRDIPTNVLKLLSEFFNCTIDYLLGKTNIRNIEDEFKFAYHKEIEGLTEEEIKEALEFYKMVKNRKNEKNEEKK